MNKLILSEVYSAKATCKIKILNIASLWYLRIYLIIF